MRRLSRIIKSVLFILLVGVFVAITFGENEYKRKELLDVKYNGFVQSPDAEFDGVIRLHNQEGDFFCTGFVISNEYALTAAHCIDDSNIFGTSLTPNLITIKSSENAPTGIEARAAAMDQRRNIGLLRGNFTNFAKTRIYEGMLRITPGLTVFAACGFPGGQSAYTCSQFQVVGTYFFMIAGYGLLYPGMSGGPVFDQLSGTVVGINSRVSTEVAIITPLIGALAGFGIEKEKEAVSDVK